MEVIEILKGTRYYSAEEQILREEVIEIIKKILERYGFNPIETPILQLYKLLSSKYAGGEEILEECYRLKDRGGRDLGLRYELTINLVPFLFQNPNIKLPFKRYEIGKIFRDGPVKKARAREFTQLDFDIVGAKSALCDLEILAILDEVFRELNLDVEIILNNRKILIGCLEYAGINKNQNSIILTIDKLEKIGEKEVKKELREKGLKGDQINKIFKVVSMKGSNQEILEELRKVLTTKNGKEGLREIEELLKLAEIYKLNVKFSPYLARGLGYYTGSIYEVFDVKRRTKSSLAAGGRYDNLFKNFLGRDLPSVGASFGIDAICSVLKTKEKSRTEVYLIPVGISEERFLPILREFRREFNVDFDLVGRGISKNLEFANRNGIPFCIIVGKDELRKSKVRLKDMKSGEEKILSLEEAIKKINLSRQLTNRKLLTYLNLS